MFVKLRFMFYAKRINLFRLLKRVFMLIDTHCHLNIMVKQHEQTLLHNDMQPLAQAIVDNAHAHHVTTIINVGTSFIESKNCITLAQWFSNCYAVVGIHPNDCKEDWRKELHDIEQFLKQKNDLKIVGIGECGLDFHYPDYNKHRQKDAFKAQIECALEHDLALVVHTRDARDETLRILEEYKNELSRGIIHCFSEDLQFAQQVIEWHFALGIGGTISYPKNNYLRDVVTNVNLSDIVLETDAPFLPPQSMRGKMNHPSNIALIAQYIAELRSEDFEMIASATTENASAIFKLPATTTT